MKKLLTLAAGMCFSAAMLTAQTTPSSTPQEDKPGANPTATPTQTTPSTSSTTTGSGSQTMAAENSAKAGKEEKLKGCIQEQNGKFVLVNEKYGNGVELISTENLSAHVGHEVKVTGRFAGAMASDQGIESSAGATPSSSAASTAPSSTTAPSTTGSATAPSASASSTAPSSATSSTGPVTVTAGSTTSTTTTTVTEQKPAESAGSATSASSLPQSDQPAAAGNALSVSKIEMISAKCKMKDNKTSSDMNK